MRPYPEYVKLTHNQRQKGDFQLLMPLIKEAQEKKFWLYHKGFGSWYTPEEFLRRYENYFLNNYDIGQFQENLIVRDPRTGNVAYQKAIRDKTAQHQREIGELTKKGQEFFDKLIEYYQHVK